jgi:hypothetical protein
MLAARNLVHAQMYCRARQISQNDKQEKRQKRKTEKEGNDREGLHKITNTVFFGTLRSKDALGADGFACSSN